ncbi:MAG: response regulator [Clostridia bacterium]|nr:response regulator [Clostridia bacterium]
MRLLIVDDDKIEREALKQFFNKNKDLEVEVVGEAINGLEAIKLNQDLKPDLILMDICLGILDGLKATEIIRKHSPHVEIIILTAFRSFEYSRQAIKNRVFDYLLKPDKEKELIASIEKVKKHIMLQKQF